MEGPSNNGHFFLKCAVVIPHSTIWFTHPQQKRPNRCNDKYNNRDTGCGPQFGDKDDDDDDGDGDGDGDGDVHDGDDGDDGDGDGVGVGDGDGDGGGDDHDDN